MKFGLAEVDTVRASEEGADLKLKKIDGRTPLVNKDGVQMTLKLLGPDSAVYRRLYREQVQSRLARRSAGEDPLTPEEEEESSIKMLADLTVDWNGIPDETGKPMEFSKEGVAELYRQYPVIRDQADVFSAQRANFTAAS